MPVIHFPGFRADQQEIHTADDTLVVADMRMLHIFDTTSSALTATLDEGSNLTLMDWVIIGRIGSKKLEVVTSGSDTMIITSGYKVDNNESRYMSSIALQLVEVDVWYCSKGASFGVWNIR